MKVCFSRNGFIKVFVSAIFLLSMGTSLPVSSQTLANQWQYDLSLPGRFYSPYNKSPVQIYYDATSACVAAMPGVNGTYNAGSGYTITYSNPRPGIDPTYGFGCYYDVKLWITSTGKVVGDTPNWFGQNWIGVTGICPKGATYVNGFCQQARPPQASCACDKVGDPILPSLSSMSQTEVDYQGKSSRNPLFFARQYSSWHFQTQPNTLGSNWFIKVFGRYLSIDTTFIVATRALSDTVAFDLSGSSWVPRSPTADTLVAYSDGNGSAWRYYDGTRQAYEYYNANGVLLSIQQLTGDTYTLSYSDTTTPNSIAPVPGLLITISSSSGDQINLTYNSQGLLSQMQDPAGQIYNYSYGGTDVPTSSLAAVTYPDNTSRQYKYEVSNGPMSNYDLSATPAQPLSYAQVSAFVTTVGVTPTPADLTYHEQYLTITGENQEYPLTGIIDESGNRFATWQYDAQGRPILSMHANNAEQVSLIYNSATSIQVTSALGSINTYTYTNQTNRKVLSSISGPPCTGCGRYKSYVYNSNGTIYSATDWNNYVTYFVYNASGLETSRTEAYNTAQARTTTTTWHATYRLPLTISVYNGNAATGTSIKTTTYTYDANGNALTKTITDPVNNVSRTWIYSYNSYGQVLTVDGPRTDVSDITTYSYYTCNTGYQCGQINTITNAAGQVTTFNTYNANSQPLTITDANGVVTTLTYDARQRLTSRTVGTETTLFAYYPTGLLQQVTLPDGSYLAYTYDAAHRLTQITDANGNKVIYTLDAMGNHTAENLYDPSNALAHTHSRVFNSLNQLYQDINSANTAAVTTTLGYDNNGNQTTINAPLTRNTTNTYDALNRLNQVTDPNNGITKYTYDANNNLISVIDPRNLTTSFTYNGLGDLTKLQSPDTGGTNNSYDSAGNLQTSKDANNNTVTYSYDQLNRVMQAAYSDQTISYQYDQNTYGKGHLTGITDNSGGTSFAYTAQGRIASKTQITNGITHSVGYSYNSAGQLIQLTTPSGQNITYTYSNGKITSISMNNTPLITSITYDPFGPITQWTWGNGSQTQRTYDDDGNLTSVIDSNTNTYTFDNAFRITANTDGSDSTLSWNYGYDSLDRITSASTTNQSETFSMDANGNRLTQGGATSTTFTNATTSNRLSSSSTTGMLARTYSYDNDGHTLSDGQRTFTYNDAGRMTTASSNGVTTTYAYNALGQRVEKSNSNGTTYFTYDEAGHLLGEYDQSGALIQELVWLNDIPVATIRTDQSGGSVGVFYIHTDHLNAPAKITRPSDNAVIWRWDHDPYGNGTPNEDPDGNGLALEFNLAFPGQYRDKETGLLYNWNRYYDPPSGRYWSSDPIGLRGGINTYAYAAGNPIIFVDPFGLCWIYHQSTGQMDHVDGDGNTSHVANGYSGHGVGVNNPNMQNARNQGPIPQGSYIIGGAHDSNTTGPGTMNLTPQPGTDTFGRDAFRIHGDNAQQNQTASEGCIVLNRDARNQIDNSDDKCLTVVQ